MVFHRSTPFHPVPPPFDVRVRASRPSLSVWQLHDSHLSPGHLPVYLVGDLVRRRDQHAIELVDVAGRDGMPGMADHRADGVLGEAQVVADAGEGMTQGVRSDAGQLRLRDDPLHPRRERAVMPLRLARRRQHIGVAFHALDLVKHLDRALRQRAHGSAGLGVAEP